MRLRKRKDPCADWQKIRTRDHTSDNADLELRMVICGHGLSKLIEHREIASHAT